MATAKFGDGLTIEYEGTSESLDLERLVRAALLPPVSSDDEVILALCVEVQRLRALLEEIDEGLSSISAAELLGEQEERGW